MTTNKAANNRLVKQAVCFFFVVVVTLFVTLVVPVSWQIMENILELRQNHRLMNMPRQSSASWLMGHQDLMVKKPFLLLNYSLINSCVCLSLFHHTVEPWYFELGQRDWEHFVCYDKVLLYQGQFFSIYFTITGVKKIVHFTEDFVIWRFYCILNCS